MPEIPVLTIVHELPGRLRLRVSRPLDAPKRFEASVKGHDGILCVAYTPVTRSILVRFDCQKVTKEEMIIRVGLSLALAFGSMPIRIFAEPDRHELSDSAFYSGFLLVIALVNRVVNRQYKSGSWLEWIVGIGTAWSVLEHGVSEVKERGNFDPEVLSAVYLVTSLIKGNFLPAAIFTWLTTFGRHLVHMPAAGIELRPLEFADEKAENPYYEVVISPISPVSEKRMLLSLLPSLVKYAATGKGEGGRGNLLEDIRNVSELHGEMLEGLDGLRGGIPLKIR